ncbi:hypothetical protein FGIG_07983 [Fasciola gigantica]|uniref:Uncharacterized protein n=1 Tax=Fasciola gigantica TaxID=46835 RepID=A0A504YR31_FASGI|nr:hypothetical protein FGIG_07983 [Fasciola gigantica]
MGHTEFVDERADVPMAHHPYCSKSAAVQSPAQSDGGAPFKILRHHTQAVDIPEKCIPFSCFDMAYSVKKRYAGRYRTFKELSLTETLASVNRHQQCLFVPKAKP